MYKILIEVHYKMKRGMRDAFLREVMPYADMSRGENGNISYNYYLNPNDDDELLLIEKWRDDEILSTHFSADHFVQIGHIKEKYVEDTVVTKHYVNDTPF
ncbi:MAG: antibiotic biosynthesis monooxygenase family protein [Bacillota bacterium]|nr:antibiotic biosynthesis monooxygenase family protein [Bacillota bacterium]